MTVVALKGETVYSYTDQAGQGLTHTDFSRQNLTSTDFRF